MRKSINSLDEHLRENGIKASYQRIKIFEYLYNSYSHPTVGTIYDELKGQVPSLSRATVYNTMNLFVEKELAVCLKIDGNEARYDLKDPEHAHFKCLKCEKVLDLELSLDTDKGPLKNYVIQEQQILLRGICPECQESLQK